MAPPKKSSDGPRHVRYIGLGAQNYCCPACSRSFRRGFYWEDNKYHGCSVGCISAQYPSEVNDE